MFYKNDTHRNIYRTTVVICPRKQSPQMLAALYLLSADQNLWKAAREQKHNKRIDFDRIKPDSCSHFGYTLLKTAEDICDDTKHMNLRDLSNVYTISDKMLELIYSALKIARDGYAAIGVDRAI